MGFSHERGAAVRTILRIRAIAGDNRQVIEDAETAVSGYLDMEDFDEYAGYHAPSGLTTDDPVIALLHERDHYKNVVNQLESQIEDILTETLGYELFAPGEPGYIALEAVRRISRVQQNIDQNGV